jgi:hypothetical protein
MNTPKHRTPAGDAVRRVLATSDSDAVVILLAFLIVAVCGACELVLFLPHALGAAMGPARADPAPIVAQTPHDEALEWPAAPVATRQPDTTVAREGTMDGSGWPDERPTLTR